MLNGISYWSLPGGLEGSLPVVDAVEQAQSIGFEALELCIAESGEFTVDSTEDECREIGALIDSLELKVETLASGMSWAYNPLSDDSEVRERSIELHQAALQRAAWLGCEAMLFVPGVVCSPITPAERVRYDHAIERAEDAVARLLTTAEKVGVDLCIENVWNGLFYSPIELASFVDSFKSNRLGVYFDIGNVLGYQQYPPHWIELLNSRIKRVHIKDFKESFGWQGSYEFCGLSEGDVPLLASIKALESIDYDKTIVAEMLPWKEGLPEQTFQELKVLLMP